MKKLSYILTNKQKIQLISLVFIIIIGAMLETIGVSAILPIVYVIMDEESIYSNKFLNVVYTKGNFEDVKMFMIVIIIVIIALYVIKNIFLIIRNYSQYAYVNNTQRELAERMMKCYIRQPYLYHTEHNSATIQRNIVNDAGTFIAYVSAMIDTIVNTSLSLLLIIYMLMSDFVITIILGVIFGLFAIIFLKPYSKILNKYGKDSRECGEKMIQWINQSLGGIKEVKILGKENYFLKHFSGEYKRSANAQKMSQFLGSVPGLVIEALCMAGILGAIAVEINAGINAVELVPKLSVIALAGVKLLSAFNGLIASISRMIFTKPSRDAVYEDLVELEKLAVEEEKIVKKDTIPKSDIEIKNVSFSYPGSHIKVIDNVSLSIKRGSSVAFIGPSGTGKTTFVDIILGVLEPISGDLSIGNINMMDDVHLWHKAFGYIPQNIYLMDDTVRNNVAFGIDRDHIDDKKVWEALEKAQLKEYVEELEGGLDSVVGEWGTKLSGGQRQRIGIARALYNETSILVLDEATSALDNETEKMIMESVEKLRGEITVIIIAHRLSTIKSCDHIYEIKDGYIYEKNWDEIG